jgi:hypothetical protein
MHALIVACALIILPSQDAKLLISMILNILREINLLFEDLDYIPCHQLWFGGSIHYL